MPLSEQRNIAVLLTVHTGSTRFEGKSVMLMVKIVSPYVDLRVLKEICHDPEFATLEATTTQNKQRNYYTDN